MTNEKIQAVIFDWGDTVMVDFPQYSGSMVTWPHVEAVPGIHEALENLRPQYKLAIATNASVSGKDLVKAALRKLGLDEYFNVICAASEIGASKPDPAFYHAVVDALDCDPQEAVMVGDSYRGDVAGAKNAGLSAIWYNPKASPAPGLSPVMDAEILALQDLPGLLASSWLPDVSECLTWLAEQQAGNGLLDHVSRVGSAAYLLADWLRKAGEHVDPLLAHRGGLLHDLDKISSKQAGIQHSELSYRLLLEKNQAALAEIARRHLMYNLLDPTLRPLTWEQKVVHYADKIVEQDQVVDVGERLRALQSRYPMHAEQIRACEPDVYALQAEISSRIGVPAEELSSRVRDELNGV